MRRSFGSIIQLGENYYQVFATGKYIDPKTGKKPRKSKRVHGNMKKAEQELRELQDKVNAMRTYSLTPNDFVPKYFIPNKEKLMAAGKFKQSTLDAYSQRLRDYVLPLIGDKPLAEISSEDCEYVQNSVESEALKKEIRKAMSSMFSEAIYEHLIDVNPVKNVRPPVETEYEPEVLDIEDIEVYLWHFRDTVLENAVLLALGASLRRAEIIGADVEDINFQSQMIRIYETYTVTSKGVTKTDPKNHRPKMVAIPRFILDRLEVTLPSSGPVMTSGDGERMRPDVLTRLYRRWLKTLPPDVPQISLKNLRHSAQTFAYEVTGDVDRVARHGGHSKQVLKKHYLREYGRQERLLADEIDRFAMERDIMHTNVRKSTQIAPDRTERAEKNAPKAQKQERDSEESQVDRWCPQRESNPCLSLERSKWCFGTGSID